MLAINLAKHFFLCIRHFTIWHYLDLYNTSNMTFLSSSEISISIKTPGMSVKLAYLVIPRTGHKYVWLLQSGIRDRPPSGLTDFLRHVLCIYALHDKATVSPFKDEPFDRLNEVSNHGRAAHSARLLSGDVTTVSGEDRLESARSIFRLALRRASGAT